MRLLTIFCTLALCSAAFSSAVLSQAIFTDITSSAGVDGIGIGGHGLGIGDVNGDGLLDMYVTNSNHADTLINQLFINQGNNVFEDVAEDIGVDDSEHIGGHGVILADIDNDQDVDIYIGNMGPMDGVPNRNTLFRNDGNLSFQDVSMSAGIGTEYTATRGVTAMDFDSDGDLDLLSSPFHDLITLYLNDGSGYFQADVRGVEDDTLAKQGISAVDIENDGDVDLYVNKWGQSPNRLFLNDGNGYFTERAESLGIDTNEYHNNGGTFADIDNDGDMDLFVISRTGADPYLQVFRNENGIFVDETNIHNIIGDGFSPAVGDADNDGDQDLFVTRASLDFALYMNDGYGYYSERTGSGVEVTGSNTRASSFVDFDNDGDLDLMVVQKRDYSFYFRNETDNTGFFEIRLIGPTGEKYGMGTRMKVYEAGHAGDDYYLRGYRELSNAMGYLSQGSPVLHFGQDDGAANDVLLYFATGEDLLLKNVTPGLILDVDARNQSPQPFELLTPTLGDTIRDPFVFLDWDESFDSNPWDSVLYDLYYGASQVFEPSSTYFEQGLSASEFTMQTGIFTQSEGDIPERVHRLSPEVNSFEVYDDVMIHWKVLSYDTRADTTRSTPQQSSFYISKPEPPAPFHLALPVDGDTVHTGCEINFVWMKSSDPDPYDSLLTYHITASLDPVLSDTLWTFTTYKDTTYLSNPFETDITLYWNVVAEGRDGLTRPSTAIYVCNVVEGSGVDNGKETTGNLPRALEMVQNYPNPFNPSTTIKIAIPDQDDKHPQTELKIYNLRGRRVRTVFQGVLEAGEHSFVWDGRGDDGIEVSSGFYFTVLNYGAETKRMKMFLNK